MKEQIKPTIPLAIQWYDGMLLSPQHFQQQAQRHEALMSHLLARVSPYYWGIVLMEIDLAALKTGIFRLIRLEAVMPDATVILYNNQHDKCLELALSNFQDQLSHGESCIYLQLPASHGRDATPGDPELRFDSVQDKHSIVDQNTGDNGVNLIRLKHCLDLSLSPKAHWTSLPLAKVVFNQMDYALTDYLAPWLSIDRSTDVGQSIAKTVASMRQKALWLSQNQQKASGGEEEEGQAVMTINQQLRITALCQNFPSLEVLINSRQCHPFALYQSLAQTIGNLALLNPGWIPQELPVYDHDNWWLACVRPALQTIGRLTDRITPPYTTQAFKREALHFALEWHDQLSDIGTMIVGISGGSHFDEAALEAWIHACVIASKENIQALRTSRSLGAARVLLSEERGKTLKLFPLPRSILVEIDLTEETLTPGDELTIMPNHLAAKGDSAKLPVSIQWYEISD